MATGSSDTPAKVNLTFSALDKEATPEPFVYTTKASKRVTFPDMYALEAEEGDKFLEEIAVLSDAEFLAKWLPKTDMAALKADKLTVRQRKSLLNHVMVHYQSTMGDMGEGPASAS